MCFRIYNGAINNEYEEELFIKYHQENHQTIITDK